VEGPPPVTVHEESSIGPKEGEHGCGCGPGITGEPQHSTGQLPGVERLGPEELGGAQNQRGRLAQRPALWSEILGRVVPKSIPLKPVRNPAGEE
jgi:hypothetical protein